MQFALITFVQNKLTLVKNWLDLVECGEEEVSCLYPPSGSEGEAFSNSAWI